MNIWRKIESFTFERHKSCTRRSRGSVLCYLSCGHTKRYKRNQFDKVHGKIVVCPSCSLGIKPEKRP